MPHKNFSSFHKRDCLLGNFPICGVKTLKIYPFDLNSERLVTWRKISYVVVGKSADGHDKKISKVEYCETQPSQLIGYLKPRLQEFVLQNFTSKWQEKEFKSYVPNLTLNTIFSCIDFFENYAFKVQNEIQDMHWYSFHITNLVHITYWINPYYDVAHPKSKILKEVHYYILDEKEHDMLFM
jgi:hypothetical protein